MLDHPHQDSSIVRKPSLIALASLALASCQSDSPVAPTAPHTTPQTSNGAYVVVMRPTTSGFAAARMQSLVDASSATVEHTYSTVFDGFSARMSDSAASALRQRADVQSVEPDAIYSISATQTPAQWDLDRLDQSALPLDNSYTTATSGNGVSAYIIDTGIRTSHSEFGGRAVGAYSALSADADDCNGHGTHVAGTVGGKTFGVAKSVKLYAVKVLDCSGNGRLSGILAGIDWVTKNAVKPAVANMSLGGGASPALDAAVQNSIASGITYAIAAGNSANDACNESPARAPAALTAAASNQSDYRAGFSNYGSCVDLFAPGVDVASAWNGSDSDARYASGTSMAAPHVAGVAALYLETHPSASAAQVAAALIAAAGVDRVQDAAGSPNRLLSTVRDASPPPPPAPPVDQTPVAAFSASCVALTCSLDASTSTDDGQIVLYNWSMPGATVTAAIGVRAAPVYTSSGVKTITLTVTDNTGKTGAIAQTVTVTQPNQPPVAQFSANCTYLSCSFDGASSTDDTGIADYAWTWSGAQQSGSANGAVAAFRFPSSGNYTVVLTVRDIQGATNSLSRTITATAANQSPSASISTPANNSSTVLGSNITFTGAANDPEDGALGGSSLVWTSSINGVIGGGTSFSTTALSVGTHVITLTAKDAQGASAFATQTVVVIAPNQAPSANIASPANNSRVLLTTIIAFVGSGNDPEDGVLSGASMVWTSNINGVIGTGASFSTDVLSVGTHVITLTVKDSQGAAATSTCIIIVGAPNQAPTASISSPTNNSSSLLGSSITFAGTGNDPEDGVLGGASLVWASNINGVIGTGSSFSTNALSVGVHVITLTVKDAGSLMTSATRTITVTAPNQAPSASIASPSNNSTVITGTVISFAGSGNDAEDGTLSGGSMIWTSSINGVIGTGTSFSSGALSLGTHVITLTVKDSQGQTATSVAVVTVVAAPNVPPTAGISSPSGGLSVGQGTNVNFAGSGNDAEDGALGGGSMIWTSSINGDIGSGNSFSTSGLSAGIHTITLVVKDSQGATASASITMTVTIPNRAPSSSIASPGNGSSVVEGSTVDFSGSGTDPEDGTLSGASLSWSSSRDGTIGSGTSFSVANLSVGTHVITLVARDAEGLNGSASTTITITATPVAEPPAAPTPTPPVANFTFLCPSGGIGRYCRFDASSSSDASGIVTYSWNYGDNRSESLAAPTKILVYPRSGTYDVTLTVTSGDGTTSSVTKTIVVR